MEHLHTGYKPSLVLTVVYQARTYCPHVPPTCTRQLRFISCVEVFHCETGDWIHQPTSGAPPLGVSGYGCTAVGDTLHFFGGYCNHGDCYHNSIHSLSTSSLHWVELSPTTSEGGAPMRKCYCGTVAFKDGEEDILYVVAGRWSYSIISSAWSTV